MKKDLKLIVRLIELRVIEPVLFLCRSLFGSEEKYYSAVMSLRNLIRSIGGLSLTANIEQSKPRANTYTDRFNAETRVLEIGCGELGLGFHLIKYLPPGAYVGVDISRPTLKTAENIIKNDVQLTEKIPKVLVTKNANDVGRIAQEQKSNTFIFNSVFTHMSATLIEDYLMMLGQLPGPNLTVIGDICVPNSGGSFQERGVDFRYTVADFKKLCGNTNWKCDTQKDSNSTDVYTSYIFTLTQH